MRRIIPLSGPPQIFTSHSSTRSSKKTNSPCSNDIGDGASLSVPFTRFRPALCRVSPLGDLSAVSLSATFARRRIVCIGYGRHEAGAAADILRTFLITRSSVRPAVGNGLPMKSTTPFSRRSTASRMIFTVWSRSVTDRSVMTITGGISPFLASIRYSKKFSVFWTLGTPVLDRAGI